MTGITKGDIIKLSFTGKLDNGTVFDTTDEKVAKENEVFDEKRTYEPMTVVVGSNTLVQGLEEDLPGKKKGYKGKVEVPPEKGYGFRSLELIETVSSKKFAERPELGAWVESNGRVGVIESVSGGRIKVDYNEPLAGKTLTFEYKIEDILEDKGEKTEAIVHGYLSPEATYTVEGDTVTIDVPKQFYLSEEWALGKILIARFLTSFVGYKQVTYKETYTEEDLAEKAE